MPTMIVDFFGFDIPRNHFKLISISKTLNLKQPDIWKAINFIRRHKICRVWYVSLSHYPSQHLRVFCHLMRLYFPKRATTMSLNELICGLTRRQESSGTLQTLTWRKSPLRVPVFNFVVTRSVETSFLRGLQYANVSLTHSGVDTVRNYVGSNDESTRASPTPSWNSNRACFHVGIVTEPDALLE